MQNLFWPRFPCQWPQNALTLRLQKYSVFSRALTWVVLGLGASPLPPSALLIGKGHRAAPKKTQLWSWLCFLQGCLMT